MLKSKVEKTVTLCSSGVELVENVGYAQVIDYHGIPSVFYRGVAT